MAENLLDIVTKVNRPTITIDGELYSIRHPDELSLKEFHKLGSSGRKLEQIGEQYESDPEGSFKELQTAMFEVVKMILPDLPREVREKLNPYHVQRLLQTFTQLSRAGGVGGEQPSPPKSSPGSSDSTAAAPAAG